MELIFLADYTSARKNANTQEDKTIGISVLFDYRISGTCSQPKDLFIFNQFVLTLSCATGFISQHIVVIFSQSMRTVHCRPMLSTPHPAEV